ncbi:hypothetical protein DFH08DRAFT_815244 [Mycena albidolilacea]|uniref:Uncharacterized protein n=1 Tax=Mycena albidolilacea TaxID=1033008 RepID=A0AAD7EJ62_9AGAR|nr:hypothetical protein DFH08DRAFT_815244 [Mycena albidolilacea]
MNPQSWCLPAVLHGTEEKNIRAVEDFNIVLSSLPGRGPALPQIYPRCHSRLKSHAKSTQPYLHKKAKVVLGYIVPYFLQNFKRQPLNREIHSQSAVELSPGEIVNWIPENTSAVTSCKGDGISWMVQAKFSAGENMENQLEVEFLSQVWGDRYSNQLETSDSAETLKTNKSPISLGISCGRYLKKPKSKKGERNKGIVELDDATSFFLPPSLMPQQHLCPPSPVAMFPESQDHGRPTAPALSLPLQEPAYLPQSLVLLLHQARCLKSKSVTSSSKSIASSFKSDSSFKTTLFNTLGTVQYPVYIEDPGPRFRDSLDADLRKIHNCASRNARKLNNIPSDIVDEVQHKVDDTISAAAADKAATIPAATMEMGDPDKD